MSVESTQQTSVRPPSGQGTDASAAKRYRPDQGRHARMAAFWGLALILLFGCHFLFEQLMAHVPALTERIGGITIPVVGIGLTGAFLISGGVFLVGILWLARWQQKPKVADLLIDTESELRKVTWPSANEVVNTSIVVVVSVVLLMGFLALADFLLARVMRFLLFGGDS